MVKKSTLIHLTVVIIILLLILTTAFFLQSMITNPDDKDYFYSFETGMQGWKKDGTDLLNPPINWSVNQSSLMAYNGSYSIQLLLENLNDAGKIWMQRNFTVKPNTEYQVTVSYYFGSADYGDINLFTLITGASTRNPQNADDLIYQGDTGHHQNTTNLVWMKKNFTFNVQTRSDATIYVYIGVWGTWETTRIYFVDDVSINIKENPFPFSYL